MSEHIPLYTTAPIFEHKGRYYFSLKGVVHLLHRWPDYPGFYCFNYAGNVRSTAGPYECSHGLAESITYEVKP